MAMAFMMSAGSTSNRPQGCIIVGSKDEPLAMACDGAPKFMQSSNHSIHAEMNAIFNCKIQISTGTAYLTHTPCYHCVMSLIGANIKRIVYFPTKTIDSDASDAIRCAQVQSEEFKGNLNWMRDYIKTLDVF